MRALHSLRWGYVAWLSAGRGVHSILRTKPAIGIDENNIRTSRLLKMEQPKDAIRPELGRLAVLRFDFRRGSSLFGMTRKRFPHAEFLGLQACST